METRAKGVLSNAEESLCTLCSLVLIFSLPSSLNSHFHHVPYKKPNFLRYEAACVSAQVCSVFVSSSNSTPTLRLITFILKDLIKYLKCTALSLASGVKPPL